MIKELLRFKKGLLVAGVALFVVLSSHTSLRREQEKMDRHFHADHVDALRRMNQGIQNGEYFLGSNTCKGCHGKDILYGIANTDPEGNDVNLFDDWAGTMMALSAKDPLWRAQLSREVHSNPVHAASLENKCTSCHSPMGHYTAFFKGNSPYRISDMLTDTLGLDGVSCVSCHIQGEEAGTTFSGVIQYDTTRHMYGPYTNPEIGPMQLYTGFIPAYGAHMKTSQACASCHTLITDVVDMAGNYTGEKFVEQSTYHEWVNSAYPGLDKTCQTCHMPSIRGPVVIANNILNLPARTPFNLHKFMGANSFMLQLMKANKTALGITATDANMDTSIASTLRILKTATLDLSLNLESWVSDTVASFALKLTNKAGHKFPSGYPARRAFVQFVATSMEGDTLFKSGMLDPNYEVAGHDPVTEPHHQLITQESQVQIYEMVMHDIQGNRTTLLERARTKAKDNRIPPLGFTSTSSVYDTVYVAGVSGDDDFNKEAGAEGSGSDLVRYRIKVPGGNQLTSAINVYAKVYYQSVPPRWVSEMFQVNTPEINTFESMYMAADRAPVEVASAQLLFVLTPNMSVHEAETGSAITIGPNPSPDGLFHIVASAGLEIRKVNVYDLVGRKIDQITKPGPAQWEYLLRAPAGQYLVELETNKGVFVKKVIKQ
jgi:hypothetical protein